MNASQDTYVASSKDAYLLPDDSPEVMNELERRTTLKTKADVKASGEETDVASKPKAKGKTGKTPKIKTASEGLDTNTSKWQQMHQQLAESRYLTHLT